MRIKKQTNAVSRAKVGNSAKSPTKTPTRDAIAGSTTDVPTLLRASAPAGIRITKDVQTDLKNASKSWVAMCMKQLCELDDDEADAGVDTWHDDIPGALEHLTATATYNSAKQAESRPWSLRRSIGRYARSTRSTSSLKLTAGQKQRNPPQSYKVFVCAVMHDHGTADFEYGILCIKRGFQPESTMIVLGLLEEKSGYATVRQEMHVIQADVEAKDITTGPIMAMIEIGKKQDSGAGSKRERVVSKVPPRVSHSREARSTGAFRRSPRVSPVQPVSARSFDTGIGKIKKTSSNSPLKHITFVGTSLT